MIVFRLDDASDYMDVERWDKVESIFDTYGIKPLVGIIPNNEDTKLTEKYQKDENFWNKAINWQKKGWRIALHGYNHAYLTECAGINPVNNRSEFAGVSLDVQKQKIRDGYRILQEKQLNPDVFFAPAHTYDENTLIALKEESEIRIISDTVANNVYFENGFWFIPVQSGKPRKLSFKLTTICLHPNEMKDEAFTELSDFVQKNRKKIISAKEIKLSRRKMSAIDKLLRFVYFAKRRL